MHSLGGRQEACHFAGKFSEDKAHVHENAKDGFVGNTPLIEGEPLKNREEYQ